ncbi:MAG: hypothetical protein M3R17_16490 [Bacteroidota bacterium]|nr:hypothetical protein [Bacteroidota bacterium]
MKNPAILLAIFLVIITSSFSKKEKSYTFDGKWSETWGVGQKTDIDYHDQYTIRKGDTNPITCQSSESFVFIDVRFNKDSLTFMQVNISGNDTMPYYLRIDKKGKKLKGMAYSVRGERTNIEWKRVK